MKCGSLIHILIEGGSSLRPVFVMKVT